MAFDISDVELYQFAEAATWEATSVVRYIVGPRGKVGFVRDLMVDITTSMVGATSVPELQVGISSGDYTYGRYRLGTSTTVGYNTGPYRASAEAITGNPPRTLADFTGHVVLDGGPYTSAGIAGGSYGTQVPKGRIPASGWVVTNCTQGVDASHTRIYAGGMQPFKDLVVGNLVSIRGLAGGGTAANANLQAITSLDTTAYQYFEVAQSFTGTWTNGGIVSLNVVITMQAGGTSATGGGIPRVKVQWLGAQDV